MIVERHRGSAADLHALTMPDDGERHVWLLEATAPAVVLGSTQVDDVIDRDVAASSGIDVVRRRSGGGAVWVAPDDPIWVDVVIPRTDPLWTDDVSHAFLPIGNAWVRALASLGITNCTVHDGPLVRTEWSSLVCFSGTGPGEVLRDGRKLVGISQRRTRAGARFQCAVPRRWDPGPLRSVLRDAPPAAALLAAGTGVGDLDADELVRRLVGTLEQ